MRVKSSRVSKEISDNAISDEELSAKADALMEAALRDSFSGRFATLTLQDVVDHLDADRATELSDQVSNLLCGYGLGERAWVLSTVLADVSLTMAKLARRRRKSHPAITDPEGL